MTEPRQSTVYDYSDLRLHPNGTRVYQKTTNFRPKLAQCTVQDARLNWIATDAGGSTKVPLFKKKKKKINDLEEEGDGDDELEKNVALDGDGSSVEANDDNDDDKKGKRKSKYPDHRKAKRQKFLKNDNYLATDSIPNPAESSDKSLPDPSPDLLKCIHRFASTFYSERGQLLNSSRQYRKEKKERRVKRAMDRESSPSSQSTSSGESLPQSPAKGDEDEADPDYCSEGDGVHTVFNRTTRGKRRKGRHRSEKLYVDMYKVFDGSAMMALGMLVQEHIAHLMNPSVPESWEGEIRSAYTDPWGDSPQVEDDNVGDVGEQLQGVVDGGVIDEQRDENVNQSVADTAGSRNHRLRLDDVQVEYEDGISEKKNLTDDESSRSEDTEHSSSSEAEYR